MSAAADDVKSLFGRALALPDPAARAAFLAAACGGDAALRAEVDGLLAALERAGGFLARPPAAAGGTVSSPGDAPPTAAAGDPASTIDRPGREEGVGAIVGGKYKLVEEIGEGGMGQVFMAQQTEPVKRAVAVKVIKAGMDSKAVLARFDAERQALALMDHPNIARVLDAGTTDGGRPYFVMELVKGVPITRFCDDRKLTPRQRLELFVPVCQALQHAHQKGVIHRDIKPSNVLVALYDDKPVPKVIDFGVAKATGGQLTDRTLMTGFGAVLGTPEYMSPEQASLNNLDVDTRSDVYSLGVLLYELLTGTTPVDRKSLGKAALMEILRVVREVEAPRPSAKLSTIDTLPSVAAARGSEPAKLTGLLRGELDWIVLKALEKDRTRRYETATGFAADVQRYLAGEPVQAVPPSAGYRVRKFVRRHRGAVTAAAVVAAALLVGLGGTGLGLVEARKQRDDAETARGQEAAQRVKVEEREKALADQTVLLEAQKTQAETARRTAEAARHEADLEVHDNQRMLLNLAWESGKNDRLQTILDRMRPPPGRPDFRGFETHFLDRLTHPELDATPVRIVSEYPPGGITQDLWPLGYSKGRVAYTYRLAPNQHYYSIEATDRVTGRPLAGFELIRGRWNHRQFASHVSVISGTPTRLFAAGHTAPSNFEDVSKLHVQLPLQQISVWDAHTGRRIASCERLHADAELQSQGWKHRFLGAGLHPIGSNCSRDSSRIVTQMVREVEGGAPAGRYESRAVIHDMTTGQVVRRLGSRPGVIEFALFSFDDRYVITSHKQQSAPGVANDLCTVWDATTGQALWSRASRFQGFTVDGRYVQFEKPPGAPAADDPDASRLTVLELATGEPVTLPRGEPIGFHPPPPETDWWSFIPRLDWYSTEWSQLEATNYLPFAYSHRWVDERGEIVVCGNRSGQTLEPPNAHVRVEDYVVSRCRPAQFECVPCPQLWGQPDVQFRRHENRTEVVIQRQLRFPAFLHGVDSLDVVDCETGRTRSMLLGQYTPTGIPADLHFNWSPPSVNGNTVIRRAYADPNSLPKKLPTVEVPQFAVYDLPTGKLRFVKNFKVFLKVNEPEEASYYSAPPTDVVLNPDGTRILWVDPEKNEIQYLDSTTGVAVWNYPLPNSPANFGPNWPRASYLAPGEDLWEPEFSPDGSRLILWNAQTTGFEILDTSSGRVVGRVQTPELKAKPEEVRRLFSPLYHNQFTPNGRFLLHRMTTTDERLMPESATSHLLVIDTRDWKVCHRIELPKQTPFGTGDGPWVVVPQQRSDRYVLISHASETTVWDLETGQKCGHFEGGVGESPLINEDGSRLFDLDGYVTRVIDLQRGREVLKLPRRSEELKKDPDVTRSAHHLVLSPDGKVLTTYAANPVSHVIAKTVFDGRPLSEQELANAQRVRAIQTRPIPPLRPDEIPPKREPSTASEFFDRARQLPPKEAIEAYRAAVKRDPEFSTLHALLARALQQDNNLDGALQEFREAVRLQPRDAGSHYEMAKILRQRQDLRGAATAYCEAVRHNDNGKGEFVAGWEDHGHDLMRLAWMQFELGTVLRELGELDAAEKALREAVRLEPKQAYMEVELARCLLALGKAKEVEAVVTPLVKRLEDDLRDNPKDTQRLFNLAVTTHEISSMYLWSFDGHHAEIVAWSDRAIAAFTEYYKRQPAVPDAENMLRHVRWNRAVGLHWQGKSAEALAELDRHFKYVPDRDQPHHRMFRTRFVARSGDHVGAAATVAELLKTPAAGGEEKWFYLNATLAYAQCALAAKGDDKLRAAYEENGMAMLRKALSAGLDDGVFKRTDPDLNPLRERADFKKLGEEVKSKRPSQPSPPPAEK